MLQTKLIAIALPCAFNFFIFFNFCDELVPHRMYSSISGVPSVPTEQVRLPKFLNMSKSLSEIFTALVPTLISKLVLLFFMHFLRIL